MSIESPECVDSGVGIVLCVKPLRIIVPHHLVVQLEDSAETRVRVNGVLSGACYMRPSSVLSGEHLALLCVKGIPVRRLGPVRLPSTQVDLEGGIPIELHGRSERSFFEHFGQISKEEGLEINGSAITDIPIKSGDSGSALMVAAVLSESAKA